MYKGYPARKPRVVTDLRSLIFDSADLFGDKDYLRFKHNNNLESVSFRRFSDFVSDLGTSLFDMNLSGKTAVVIGETSPEWIITYLSVIIAGGVIVPLDKDLSHQEIKNFITRSGASAVFYSESFSELFDGNDEADNGCDINCYVKFTPEFIESELSVNDGIPAQDGQTQDGRIRLEGKHISFVSLLRRGRYLRSTGHTEFFDIPQDISKMSAIIFTSGTTGTSKGVMLSQGNLVCAINDSYQMTNFTISDVIVSVLPIHHTYEMTCGILTPIVYGLTVCINDSLKYILKNFQFYKPTGLVLVPLFVSTIYKRIWDNAVKSGRDKKLKTALTISELSRKVGIDIRKPLFKDIIAAFGGRLEKIICGGAALAPELVQQFAAFGIVVSQGYGITECAPLISVCPYHFTKFGSVGLPVPGIEVMIDKEDPNASYGEIVVRGGNIMLGYYGDAEATAAAIEDGWFRTGDYGYLDEDGYLYITGRKKNVIVLNNGKNVFPEEIESYLEKVQLIAENVIIGKANESGETYGITALIFPDFTYAASIGLTDIVDISEAIKDQIAKLNKSLPSFKQIRGIEIRKTEFDKTTSHKIKRHTVKAENQ
ncbi:MAG: AMP-binding protein [Oscillospiraceae bacterium]|nr:AMP-binding protein [Oscillospiraceae bacterium]